MMYAGWDLSRQRLDVHVLDEDGRTVAVTAIRPDTDALRTPRGGRRSAWQEVSAAIESMNGARFVHNDHRTRGLPEPDRGHGRRPAQRRNR